MPDKTPQEIKEEQKKVAEAANDVATKEAAELDQTKGGNEELTASGQRRIEVIKNTAPVPEEVTNILEKGQGYYVQGRLVDPNGKPIK